jgi:hypothetical protein
MEIRSATATDRGLARQVQYLKNKNRVLRDRLTAKTQLLKYGWPLERFQASSHARLVLDF